MKTAIFSDDEDELWKTRRAIRLYFPGMENYTDPFINLIMNTYRDLEMKADAVEEAERTPLFIKYTDRKERLSIAVRDVIKFVKSRLESYQEEYPDLKLIPIIYKDKRRKAEPQKPYLDAFYQMPIDIDRLTYKLKARYKRNPMYIEYVKDYIFRYYIGLYSQSWQIAKDLGITTKSELNVYILKSMQKALINTRYLDVIQTTADNISDAVERNDLSKERMQDIRIQNRIDAVRAALRAEYDALRKSDPLEKRLEQDRERPSDNVIVEIKRYREVTICGDALNIIEQTESELRRSGYIDWSLDSVMKYHIYTSMRDAYDKQHGQNEYIDKEYDEWLFQSLSGFITEWP